MKTNAQQNVDHIEKRLEAFKTQMNEGRTLVQAAKWTKEILRQGNHCAQSPQDVNHIEQRLQAFKTQMEGGRTPIQEARWTKAILQKEKYAMNSKQDVDHIEKRLEAFKGQMDEGRTLIQAAKWTKAILQQENDSMNLSRDLEDDKECTDEQQEEEQDEKEDAEEQQEEQQEAEEEQQEQEAAEAQKQKDLAAEQKTKQEAIEKQKQEDLKKAKDAEDQAKLKEKAEKEKKDQEKKDQEKKNQEKKDQEKNEQEKKDQAQPSQKLEEVKKGESVKNPVPSHQLSTVIEATPKPNSQPVVQTGSTTSALSGTEQKHTADSSQFSSFEKYKHGSHEGESESVRWVAFHNSIRNKYFTPPVQWSEDLSAMAKKVSETCVFQHSHGDTGENIAAGEMDLGQVVHDWAYGNDESSVYDPQNPMYSHFTQIVWKRTTHIGCAYTDCETIKDVPWTGNSKFWVCEYNPPGNYAGEFIANVNAVKGGSPLTT
ncbi:uncharacterized protein MELLADRAFT_103996 [Melampsora larici-populina 98AG31]|uniref:SCP domain-containing protein n=1 Tax=Melampsora larici-populina (strain 98AG31 / pathotype 3-4-7) TaxID=747676 RepID=F4RD77_MELLP|nr:uncharacterized protein MELLADRAFT_103996 [Melampsora larici-populina 98AG31]EGG09350.1 hypothetical protein MELLADRAFT_103996 [Melampsora larici-populina 98AG31]